MKVLIVRANELRHKALSVRLIESGVEIAQLIQRSRKSQPSASKLLDLHFQARSQFEKDYFSYLNVSGLDNVHNTLYIEDLNSMEALDFATKFTPDYIITFGCSILNQKWVDQFSNKILGVHLGLSPYYRGSGTNFFPFVDGEIGAIGFTLMNLDHGIDTGAIVHQSYATIVIGDSIHSIGNRLIKDMFEDITKLLDIRLDLRDSLKQPTDIISKIYRKSDFTEKAYLKALENLQNGLINKFAANESIGRERFPIIKEIKW